MFFPYQLNKIDKGTPAEKRRRKTIGAKGFTRPASYRSAEIMTILPAFGRIVCCAMENPGKDGSLMEKVIDKEKLLNYLVDSMEEALVLVDHNLRARFLNDSAVRMFNLQGASYEGRHIFEDLKLWEIPQRKSKVQEVLDTGIAQRGIIRKTPDDKTISINIVPLLNHGNRTGVLITGTDITDTIEMQHELDMAFALTLPNSKVEYKLKSTVEYRDVFDPESRMIRITGVIPDGGYRHVVNCLKIFANLHELEITKLIGIDKDQLVKALIFHDLGKVQPLLKIGDVVDPKEVFEDGKLHAQRGADISKHFYNLPDDVVEIIRYHHHGEDELPDSFTWKLRPTFRLFQLIDGLSAAITRGGVKVDFTVKDSVITVKEDNHRPHYNGTLQVDLYTGKRTRIT
jgi:PAS domain S-box-containing protein